MNEKASELRLSYDENSRPQLTVTLVQTNTQQLKKDLAELKQRLAKGKLLNVEIKQHREKRSLDANAYMWVLLEKMSEKLPESKDAIYEKMLIDYGVSDVISVKKEAAEHFIKSWQYPVKKLGTGTINGKEFEHLRVCYGSSGYDTKEMSVLLKGIIQECENLGIDTRTPDEILKLLSLEEQK